MAIFTPMREWARRKKKEKCNLNKPAKLIHVACIIQCVVEEIVESRESRDFETIDEISEPSIYEY